MSFSSVLCFATPVIKYLANSRAMAFEDIFKITSVLGVGFSFVTLSTFDLSSQAEERSLKRRWDSEGQLLPLPFCFLRQDQGIISEGLLGF